MHTFGIMTYGHAVTMQPELLLTNPPSSSSVFAMHRSHTSNHEVLAIGRVSNPNFRTMAWFTPILFDIDGMKLLEEIHPELQAIPSRIQDLNLMVSQAFICRTTGWEKLEISTNQSLKSSQCDR
jgi:hypothetical protein